jgi:hypothetical protein
MQGLAETSVSSAAVPARNDHIGSGMYRDPLLTDIGRVNGRTQSVWEELGFRFGFAYSAYDAAVIDALIKFVFHGDGPSRY